MATAEQAGVAEVVLEELSGLVHQVLPKVEHLEDVFDSPRIPPAAKVALIERSLKGRVSDLLLDFLRVTAEHDRLGCLEAIEAGAHQHFNELRGRVVVEVHTATEIDSTIQSKVESALKSALETEVDLEAMVKEDLIGGMVVRVGDTVYDASVAHRLKELKRDMVMESGAKVRKTIDQFVSG